VPRGIVLADTAYGSSGDFRAQLREMGLTYAVAVDPQTAVVPMGKSGRPRGEPRSVRDWAFTLEARGAFRRCTWRQGTKKALSARFAMRRVKPAHDVAGEAVWLLIEWRDGEAEPANYFLASLPENTTRKRLVRLVMQRWRTERAYEDLKGELGLDHYEGRRFGGWHHHVSVALCCYAFIVAERVRHFPPSARRATGARAQSLAAPAAFPRQLHHRPSRHRPPPRHLAAALPHLSPHQASGTSRPRGHLSARPPLMIPTQ
jgi:SRSO17 transposase